MSNCKNCKISFTPGEVNFAIEGVQTKWDLRDRCMTCEEKWILKNGTHCENCRGFIYPNSQVGVMIGQSGSRLVCHTTYECSPAGGTFYGFWGEGGLDSSFELVEQC
jgi:hypothetical protein